MKTNFTKPEIGKKTATSITFSQRSTCQVVIYRFKQRDITKMNVLNVSKEKPFSGNTSSAEGNVEIDTPILIRNDVIRCNISKDKGTSSGNFSLTLKRGKEVKDKVVQTKDVDYLKIIHPGDWIMIYIKKNGRISDEEMGSMSDKSGLKFLGVIENVRYLELDDPGKAAPKLEYVVTGRDFGKVFENDVFFNPIVNNKTIQTILGGQFLTDGKNTVKGDNRANLDKFTPDFVIKSLVSFYLGGKVSSLNANNQAWYIPANLTKIFKPKEKIKSGGSSFIDILDTTRIGLHNYDANQVFKKATDLPGATLIKALPASGTVWSILQFMSNSALNEMFTELVKDSSGNLNPALVHRQMPFSNKPNAETNAFFLNKRPADQGGNSSDVKDIVSDGEKTMFVDLPRYVIQSSAIRQKNIGKSEHERLNHIMVVPKVDAQVFDILYAVAYNIPSVQRYGLKSLQTQTSYVMKSGEGFIKYLLRCVNLLTDWFFTSHQLFNGTLILDGADTHLELGTNLYISDINQLFHIEGYTHTYEIQEDGRIVYNTEVRVSRGQVFKDRQSSFIGPSSIVTEPTTISTSVLEGSRNNA